ncbi:NfeD family protein [Bacillaceae bacterium S4-13-58]
MGVFPFFNVGTEAKGEGQTVYVIPVEDDVERGLLAFLERSFEEGNENGADHFILEINTPGGAVDAAKNIGTLLQNQDVPVTSFVINEALSAGSYIALNTDHIYMTPQGQMGASGVINSDGTAADLKAQSAWIAAMTAAAESKGRDPIYAEAMANKEIDLPELGAPKGAFLTLKPSNAEKVGYSNGTIHDREELLAELELSDAKIVEMETTLAEELARLITHPFVVPILLSIASLGFIVELYSPGFGIPGTMGLVSLLLFFYGHLVAGLAGFETILLLVLGIILVVAEFFVPGGVLGIIGMISIIGSMFMAGADVGNMAFSIGIAIIISIIASVVLFKRMGFEKGFFRHIILRDATTTEGGYVSSKNRIELIGLEGKAITTLRPSGTGEFDGERIDVVTEGGYIASGTRIKIVKTEGSRVVVREIIEHKENEGGSLK